ARLARPCRGRALRLVEEGELPERVTGSDGGDRRLIPCLQYLDRTPFEEIHRLRLVVFAEDEFLRRIAPAVDECVDRGEILGRGTPQEIEGPEQLVSVHAGMHIVRLRRRSRSAPVWDGACGRPLRASISPRHATDGAG